MTIGHKVDWFTGQIVYEICALVRIQYIRDNTELGFRMHFRKHECSGRLLLSY